MHRPFGPWATMISAGQNLQLSTFWRRRLMRLPVVAQSSTAIPRRAIIAILIAGVVIGLMPTLYPSGAKAETDKPGAEKPHAQQPSQSPSDQPFQIVKQATAKSWNALTRGQGRGTCTVKLKGKPDATFDFEIAFDGDKFNFILTESPYRRHIAVSDGSATLVRAFRDKLDSESRSACIITEPQFYLLSPELPISRIDMPKNTRAALSLTCFDKFPVKVVKLPDGRLHGAYDINKYVTANFDATSDSGYNVTRLEVFNKSGSRTGTIFTAQWKRVKGVWYVAAMTREDWSQGAVVEHAEFRYNDFTANPHLPADLFSIRSLHLAPGSTIIDIRPGPSKSYRIGDPTELANSKPTIAQQVGTLPDRNPPRFRLP